MTKSQSVVQSLLSSYWHQHGLEVSNELLEHQEFLMQFQPTGDRQRDLEAFLIGVGHSEMMEIYQDLDHPLVDLASLILGRHRAELVQIENGYDTAFHSTYYRHSADALHLYKTVLQLEEQVLAAILKQPPSKAA